MKQFYEIFKGIDFSECSKCNSQCCFFPWLLKEEYSVHLDCFGKTVTQINSTAFVLDKHRCKYVTKCRCGIYDTRPLDCRLFPLDIIEEKDAYYWCIFTVCPFHLTIRKKLIPLIEKLEKMITREIFDQYKKQISVTKKIYLPYKNKQYEKIKEFTPQGFKI